MTLITKTTKIADKWTRCDAFSIWLDVARSMGCKEKQIGISTCYKARKQIETGMVYWYFEFVDDDGELHEMNCRLDMHSLMLKNNFYPNVILKLLNENGEDITGF